MIHPTFDECRQRANITVSTLEEYSSSKEERQKLIDAGFKAESKAFKKADEYDEYKKKMEEKYA